MQLKRLPSIESGYNMYVRNRRERIKTLGLFSCMNMRFARGSVHDYTKREREREIMVMR